MVRWQALASRLRSQHFNESELEWIDAREQQPPTNTLTLSDQSSQILFPVFPGFASPVLFVHFLNSSNYGAVPPHRRLRQNGSAPSLPGCNCVFRFQQLGDKLLMRLPVAEIRVANQLCGRVN